MEAPPKSGTDATSLHLWSHLRRGIVLSEGVVRYARTLRIGATTFLDYWWSLRSLQEDTGPYEVALSRCHGRAATRILRGALRNGGIYIKVGQALATLNHLMPPEFTDQLSLLQDRVHRRGYREVETLFLQDFGKTPLEIFKEFETEAFAAASLAQVHRATTRDNRKVAVKVQYIDMRDRFHGDMRTIRLVARAMDWLFAGLDRVRIFDLVRGNLAEELDFRLEARNSETCQRDLALLGYVHVPKVFWEYTSERVLTMEFIEGVKPTDVAELERHNFDRKEVAHKVVQTFNHQIFHTGFVHADPHPGNILIRAGKSGLQVVLLDHGLYTQIDTDTRVAFGRFWKSLILRDESGIRESCHLLGIEHYALFAMLTTGRTLESHLRHHRNVSGDISKHDVTEIKRFVSANQDTFDQLTRSLPAPTFLMFRNINIVRSINRALGTPVNRFQLMARSAAAADTHSRTGMRLLWHTAVFDFRLRFWSFKLWLLEVYFKVLVALGRVPPDIGNHLRQMRA